MSHEYSSATLSPTGTTSRSGVLLDRDGTIIEDGGYVGSVDRVRFIDGSIDAIAALNAAGIPVAVVTNQAGVARGYYGLEDVDAVHAHIVRELAAAGAHVDKWLFCPYHPDGVVDAFARTSADRKPNPGMALAAAQALGLDLSTSWVIGDSPVDVALARAVGARPLLVGGPSDDPDVEWFADLAAAVNVILRDHRRTSPSMAAPAPAVRFPAQRYDSAEIFAAHYADEITRALATIDVAEIDAAAKVLNAAYDRDAVVFACGNGGSASIANHLQCDHVKGVRTGTDLRTRVVSLSSNVELLSAVANDIGYESVFEFQLESQARPGDVLVVISSSGRSPNIVQALEWASAHDMYSIALTGFEGSPARELATVSIHVRSSNYGIVEDAHQACMHLLAQYVRQSRMPADAVSSQVF
jgi:D-sedoheptulose 7-phosphate isomerase/D-glycero-D-manno-heptose 1,7-bisphosphate phosphatase